ncbi:metal-dependent hydrolase [Methanocella sp. CWC-04]|uniref:Metal-dependent hydrolase n=1 Tax=Methanooceanicella nereidis TaxID=2052831 RepID=A0AAP2RCB1_9EURY|nr:metal-dependent hydrolase [Methanocella sp. CWC-04]MCD1294919.1 metal-dependent hydrolase [Methanocella sp. CWC-04]
MLLFGHIGLTLAIVFLIFMFLKEDVDFRFVLIGSMLPDIIDKPIGNFLFFDVFGNGRIFCHTLLFIAVLVGIGIIANRFGKGLGFQFLALGAIFHIAEDYLWLHPETLFWPLFGWEFPKHEYGNYVMYLLQNLFTNMDTFVPEVVGLLILGIFAYQCRLYRPDELKEFIFTGKLSSVWKGKNVAITPRA